MRYSLFALLTLGVITGCAHKHTQSVKLDVPSKCILGGLVDVAKCEAINKDEAVCNGVVVRIACVEVKK
jgi:hypothetical protein